MEMDSATEKTERSPEIKRSPRFSFDQTVHLLIPFSPWNLRLPLQAVNISNSGVYATMNPQNLGPGVNLEDLFAILNLGDEYSLQLNSSFEHLDSPVVSADIARRNFKSSRLELAFEFTEKNEDILCLVHELKSMVRIKTPNRNVKKFL